MAIPEDILIKKTTQEPQKIFIKNGGSGVHEGK